MNINVKPEKIKQDDNGKLKKEIRKKTNDKCLYKCESKLDANEYKKIAKYFPQIYWSYVVRGLICNLILSAAITILSKSFIEVLVFFIIYQVYLMFYYKIRLGHFMERGFNKAVKMNTIDPDIYVEFYDGYLIRKSETVTRKIKYSEVDKCIESDKNFYLKDSIKNIIVIIKKDKCDVELMNFIRKTFENLEKHLGDSSKTKRIKKYSNPDFIKRVMSILFVITIVSFWLAMLSFSLVNELIPHHYINQFKNMWVFWCWLPIPILSIILGIKFNKAKLKCTQNIVAGFIVGILLIIFGAFCLMPTASVDYKEIDKYRNIIDAKLPKNGELVIENWDVCSSEDKTECTIINAYYNNVDVSDLVNSVENSNNWFLSKKIKSALEIFIPLGIYSDEDAYYSIYNKTTNQYNTLPEVAGNYEIYVSKYDKSDKHLEIYEFKYNYK